MAPAKWLTGASRSGPVGSMAARRFCGLDAGPGAWVSPLTIVARSANMVVRNKSTCGPGGGGKFTDLADRIANFLVIT